MNLYLLRHGIAVERGTAAYHKDSARPLTPKGERKVWQIAEAMEALRLSFDLILSSPYARARQTAEIVAEAFNARKRVELREDLTPGGSTKRLVEHIASIKPAPENVLLVGHEPYLSDLISLLVAGDRDPLYPVELAVELYRGLPRASLWVVPDGGHSPVFGAVAPEFARHAARFFELCDSGL